MLATVGVITTEAGFRWPGYLSKSLDLKFSDVPGGALDSYAAVPAIGWLQIVAFVVFLELAWGATDPAFNYASTALPARWRTGNTPSSF